MRTLKVGIASYEEMKARTLRIARGEHRPSVNERKVWFTSTESFAKVLSVGNRELLQTIADKAPGSLFQDGKPTDEFFEGEIERSVYEHTVADAQLTAIEMMAV
jgi:predicted transcriptional regulator